MLTPAWNSSVIDPVPRDEWPQAITAVSIAYNAARAVGPTLAGLVFAHWGAGWVFAISVLSTLVMWESIRRWPPKAHPPSRLPAERLWGGMLSGLRFAWHSDLILAQLVRVMAFGAAGSALWALLPVIAQRQLGTGAQGFGLLMGCLGTGAVTAGLVLGKVRARFSLDTIVLVSGLVFAGAMVVAALTKIAPLVYLAMLLGGAAWMSAMSTFNTATQASAPPWVRSRAVALHMVAALGAFALGSAFWGAASDVAGLAPTLCAAAAAMGVGLLLARPMPLRMGALHEVTPATPWDELFIEAEPLPEAGPVAVEIGERFMPTLLLTISSMAWSVVFGMGIGIISAVYRNRWPDRLGMTLAVSGISFPAFALGMLLMQVFSVNLGWLPTVGATTWVHYILPSLTLGAAVAAVMARFTRASFVEVVQEDFVRTARAKGLSERVVVLKHCLRNALIPVVTMMGLQFGFLLGGSIVVEAVFNWPGLGRLLVDAVTMRDYPVIQTLVLLLSLEFILINLVVDMLYGFINPTIRYK